MLAPWPTSAIEALQRVPLLSKLDKKELKSMSREMSERTFPQGAEVTATGKSGVGFFIIDAGNRHACASATAWWRASRRATTSARWR